MNKNGKKTKVLVFKTVNDIRTKSLLNRLDFDSLNMYMVLPENMREGYSLKYSQINYIGTKCGIMNYEILSREKNIPDIRFDEVWILSASFDSMYSYTEVYKMLNEIKYKKFRYFAINDGRIEEMPEEEVYSILSGHRVKNYIANAIVCIQYIFETMILGYKW